MRMRAVVDAFVHGCELPVGAATLLDFAGAAPTLRLAGNHTGNASAPVRIAAGAGPDGSLP